MVIGRSFMRRQASPWGSEKTAAAVCARETANGRGGSVRRRGPGDLFVCSVARRISGTVCAVDVARSIGGRTIGPGVAPRVYLDGRPSVNRLSLLAPTIASCIDSVDRGIASCIDSVDRGGAIERGLHTAVRASPGDDCERPGAEREERRPRETNARRLGRLTRAERLGQRRRTERTRSLAHANVTGASRARAKVRGGHIPMRRLHGGAVNSASAPKGATRGRPIESRSRAHPDAEGRAASMRRTVSLAAWCTVPSPGRLVHDHNAPWNGRCRMHGGLSTGARTPEGRARLREAGRKGAAIRWGRARASRIDRQVSAPVFTTAHVFRTIEANTHVEVREHWGQCAEEINRCAPDEYGQTGEDPWRWDWFSDIWREIE